MRLYLTLAITLLISPLFSFASPWVTEWSWYTTVITVHPDDLSGEPGWPWNWIPPGNNGDGVGWWTEIFNLTDDIATAGSSENTLGWFDGYGYVISPFRFTATEGDIVEFRLYNATHLGSATYVAISQPLTLPAVSEPPVPDDLTVEFVIPEPTTALLLVTGAMSCWLLRRNNRMGT